MRSFYPALIGIIEATEQTLALHALHKGMKCYSCALQDAFRMMLISSAHSMYTSSSMQIGWALRGKRAQLYKTDRG